MENIRVENWCGYDIRFVEHEGAWYAVLKDICDALGLRTDKVKLRVDSLHLRKLGVQCIDEMPETFKKSSTLSGGINFSEYSHTHHMLCVDEAGIYQALSRSTRLEARQFIDWFTHSLIDLRKAVGLEGYEAMRLTESTIQEAISKKIDISYIEPTGDLIPVEATPTVVNNITNVHKHYDINYGKVAIYVGVGVVGGIVVYHSAKYAIKKVKEKKNRKKDCANSEGD